MKEEVDTRYARHTGMRMICVSGHEARVLDVPSENGYVWRERSWRRLSLTTCRIAC
jgi:hypothetical protein